MSRPKIKSKVVRGTLANKDVLDMFHGVLGTSDGGATLSVTHPKYLRILTHVERFLKLLAVLRDSQLLRLFPGPQEHLALYVAALQGQFAEGFSAPDLAPYLPPAPPPLAPGAPPPPATAEDYARVPAEAVAQFSAAFTAVKGCSLVNAVVVTCMNLTTYKKSLQDQKALKDRFLRGAGLSVCPLPDLPQLNFKQVYIDDRLGPPDREFVLVILHKLYTIGHDVYEAVSAPDVDMNEFVEVIMSSIGEVKKHIPRCDQAFAKITESVDLLKGNFEGYHKEYVASGNPTIIMENFVLDVSKNTQSSPQVTAQFRRIITHYRKLAAQQASHPKLQSLFQQVDKNFQELESKGRAADGASESEDSEDEAEAEGEGEGGAEAAGLPAGASPSSAELPAAPPLAAPLPGPKAARNRRKKVRAKTRRRAAASAAGDSLAEEFDRALPPDEAPGDDAAPGEGEAPGGGEGAAPGDGGGAAPGGGEGAAPGGGE